MLACLNINVWYVYIWWLTEFWESVCGWLLYELVFLFLKKIFFYLYIYFVFCLSSGCSYRTEWSTLRCKTAKIRLGYRAEWSTLQCKLRNIILGYRTEWSTLQCKLRNIRLGYRTERSTLRCETANIRLGYRAEWSTLGAKLQTLD